MGPIARLGGHVDDGRATQLELPGNLSLRDMLCVKRSDLLKARENERASTDNVGAVAAWLVVSMAPSDDAADPAAVRGLHANGGLEANGRGYVGHRAHPVSRHACISFIDHG
jgi:hypothetical protein